jgi:dUTP pyrophosphatase
MIRKIKYKLITEGCAPVVTENGDAFDLRAAKDVKIKAPTVDEEGKVTINNTLVPLGIAMELPKGCIANVRPRSSTYKKWYVIQSNSVGLIDETYCGDADEWQMPVIAFKNSKIAKGERICQFEIRPSQKATFWQKLKWMLTSEYKFVAVDTLNNTARGGFGDGTKEVK